MSLILDLLFPKTCFACGCIGSYFCHQCFKDVVSNSIEFKQDSILEGSLSIFKYQSKLKKALKALKYNFITDMVDELSEICIESLFNNFSHLVKYWQDNNFVLIPIPLHSARRNWRGFNQSSLIGEKIAFKLNLKFCNDYLIRSKNTHSQAKFKYKSQRYQNLCNAFEINPKQNHSFKNIIIFDDVATTGSTLNSAFKSLKLSDQNHCWFLTVAG